MAGGKSVVRTEADHHVPGPAATSRDRNEIRRPSVRSRRRVCRADAVAGPRVLRIIRERVQERLQRVITREFRGTFGILIGLNNSELTLPCTCRMCARVRRRTKANGLNVRFAAGNTCNMYLKGPNLLARTRDGFSPPVYFIQYFLFYCSYCLHCCPLHQYLFGPLFKRFTIFKTDFLTLFHSDATTIQIIIDKYWPA